jgi:hypothetical protein
VNVGTISTNATIYVGTQQAGVDYYGDSSTIWPSSSVDADSERGQSFRHASYSSWRHHRVAGAQRRRCMM